MNNDKVLSLISLSRKAGALIYGYDSVCKSLITNKKGVLILANDLSENTKDKILNSYKESGGLDILYTQYKKEDFFKVLKKHTGILYVFDEGLANNIKNHYNIKKGE